MDTHAELVIVGAGGAGLSAAIEAATAGGLSPTDVVLVEKSDTPGGAAAISGGGMCIVDTPLQKSMGIEDNVALAFADWIASGGVAADTEWAFRYVRDSTRDIYEWCEGLGVEWREVSYREGNSVPRWHRSVGGGAGVAACLIDNAKRLGVRWQLSSEMVGLVVENGVVTGVKTDGDDGPHAISCTAVIMATGGFVNNPRMLRQYVGIDPQTRFLCGGAPQATGSGHRLLAELKAKFVEMEQVWFYPFGTPNYRHADSGRGLAVRGLINDIWLNNEGRRFHNESLSGGGTGGQSLRKQPGQTCWTLFDRSQLNRIILRDDSYYGTGDDIRRDRIAEFVAESPYVWTAQTVEAVAGEAGLPPSAVAETVAAFNREIAFGIEFDTRFGRPLSALREINDPPYFLIQYFPLAQKNLGGVLTDEDCLVQIDGGSSVAGLYAAGEVAGMAGGHINGAGALEGTMLGPSIFSGRVAGRAASHWIRSIRAAARTG